MSLIIKGQVGIKHPAYKHGLSQTKAYQKNYHRKLKLLVYDLLGNKCCKCGFNDERALQIDHIKGGGSRERKIKNHQGTQYLIILGSLIKKENKFQLLCANCNWIKRIENNEIKT